MLTPSEHKTVRARILAYVQEYARLTFDQLRRRASRKAGRPVRPPVRLPRITLQEHLLLRLMPRIDSRVADAPASESVGITVAGRFIPIVWWHLFPMSSYLVCLPGTSTRTSRHRKCRGGFSLTVT